MKYIYIIGFFILFCTLFGQPVLAYEKEAGEAAPRWSEKGGWPRGRERGPMRCALSGLESVGSGPPRLGAEGGLGPIPGSNTRSPEAYGLTLKSLTPVTDLGEIYGKEKTC